MLLYHKNLLLGTGLLPYYGRLLVDDSLGIWLSELLTWNRLSYSFSKNSLCALS